MDQVLSSLLPVIVVGPAFFSQAVSGLLREFDDLGPVSACATLSACDAPQQGILVLVATDDPALLQRELRCLAGAAAGPAPCGDTPPMPAVRRAAMLCTVSRTEAVVRCIEAAFACDIHVVLSIGDPPAVLRDGIRTAAYGGIFCSPSLAPLVLRPHSKLGLPQLTLGFAKQESEGEGLTPREREVARLAAAGLSNQEIAEQLSIAINTVKSHLAEVFQKLGIRHRGELLRHFSPGITTFVALRDE